jgi:putative colanic acid biosynthesis UDP-glucose lipid carrier transferase
LTTHGRAGGKAGARTASHGHRHRQERRHPGVGDNGAAGDGATPPLTLVRGGAATQEAAPPHPQHDTATNATSANATPAGRIRMPPRWRRQTFAGPPPTATHLATSLVEPTVAVLTWLGARAITASASSPALGALDAGLCLAMAALSFPGRPAAQGTASATAAGEVVLGFAWRAALLGSLAALLGVLQAFEPVTLATWAVLTPALQLGVLTAWPALQARVLRHRQPLRRVVAIGAGSVASRLRQALSQAAGVAWLGSFDDRTAAQTPPGRIDPPDTGPHLGPLAEAAAWVRGHGVQDVYITLPMGMQPRIVELLQALQDTTVSLHYVPDVFGATIVHGRLQEVAGVPVVGLCETPFTGVHAVLKRVEDVLLASLILLAIAPLMAAVAVGVKLSSPGPVLFRQRRHGLDGREISVWKFRSMRVMDDGDVVHQATRDDPRVTRFGAFIRRTSLDELPQFLNVLQGTMSVVGPRPHALAHNRAYAELIRTYMVRHKVKPGITGWAQVNGHRGETDTLDKMRARLECDLEYLRHWSLALDLRIVARTVALMFFDRKAY